MSDIGHNLLSRDRRLFLRLLFVDSVGNDILIFGFFFFFKL